MLVHRLNRRRFIGGAAALLGAPAIIRPARADLRVNQLTGFGAQGDGNDANTLMLLHFDGADAATSFPNSAAGGTATATAQGNAQVDTAQSKFGTGSGLFDGTGDSLSISANANTNFSTGPLTVDFWLRTTLTISSNYYLFDMRDASELAGSSIYAYSGADASIRFQVGNATELSTGASSIAANTWYHVAGVRSGGTVYLFLDGAQKATTTNNTGIDCSGSTWRIGSRRDDTLGWPGWQDEFRLSRIARWTAAFSPANAPYN